MKTGFLQRKEERDGLLKEHRGDKQKYAAMFQVPQCFSRLSAKGRLDLSSSYEIFLLAAGGVDQPPIRWSLTPRSVLAAAEVIRRQIYSKFSAPIRQLSLQREKLFSLIK